MVEKTARFSAIHALIFDLDGTLIDSKLDLALSVNAALAEMGHEQLPHERIFGFIGQGAPSLISRCLGEGATEEECLRCLELFIQHYSIHKLDHTTVFPGVCEALDALSGIPMAVLSNKPVGASRGIVQGLGLAKYFHVIYGGNSFERKKPDPVGVETILEELGASPAETMVVGDSEIDVQTARNAGTLVCGVTYGFGSHHLVEYPPDLLLNSLAELPPYILGASVSEAPPAGSSPALASDN